MNSYVAVVALVTALSVCAACDKKNPPPAASGGGAARPPSIKSITGAAPASAPGLLAVGAAAPVIVTTAHDGTKFELAALKGKPVVVYFYPKDDTPGCTVEAEGIRDEWPAVQKTGAVLVGVSEDDAASHKAFAEKYKLPFALLPDTDHAVAGAFGVPLKMGFAKRVTFVIDRQGKIARVFPDVSPKGHALEILSAIAALPAT